MHFAKLIGKTGQGHTRNSSRKVKISARLFACSLTTCFVAMPVLAGETVLYTYDELGRLVRTQQTGSINNGVTTDIDYDDAGNRTGYEVTGSSGAGSDGGATGNVGGGSGSNTGGGGSGGGGETPPGFAVSDTSTTEGGNLVFTVTKSGSVTSSYSVSYATANGSAVTGSDYAAKSGTLTFNGSTGSLTVSVATVNDSIFEQTEAMYLNLSNPTGGSTITDSQGAGTISDNDVQNNPPTANNDTLIAFCGQGVKNVLLNDTDPDGDALSVASITGGGGMALSENNGLIIAENASTGSFTYTLQDAHGATDTATVFVTNSCGGGGPFE
ncbi:Calx-beta domain-containing protein [Parasphingorhabdus marina DSM 22363]|uniref:Calx-beta domain-containing protein n=1 Tax=Parasphingorhabdus marina DSM 22363 TaxID=1123272 RepID=A0A1N6HNB8_9SPHN|nr:Calx-beta domain-containing protein [Parasphingorhabdus marina]SIO21179.1 Calx-beta domain-containing protein [Parasphingorhabdus marina DSM 22363]